MEIISKFTGLYTKQMLCALLLFFIAGTTLKADIGTFDIITFEVDDNVYYVRLETQGKLKNNDLCLYDYDWNYIKDYSEIINNEILKTRQLSIFQSLAAIEIKHIDKALAKQIPIFYNFTDPIDFTKIQIKNPIVITSVIHGNTYGQICSKALKTSDNNWLESYEMVRICATNDGEICEMSFYAIKDNVDETYIKNLKTIIKKAANNQIALEAIYAKLYSEFIIMIGFCSC